MRNDETPYDRYRREEEELTQRLDEQRRTAEDAAEWERRRQTLREHGDRDATESGMRKIRASAIRAERKRGKSLRAARLSADELIARVRKLV
jgi:hypothetical protein